MLYCTNYNFGAAEFKTRNVSAKKREKYVSQSSSMYELSRIFTSVAVKKWKEELISIFFSIYMLLYFCDE